MADDADDLFALKLVGEGISIDKKVNRDVAMAVFAAVMNGGASIVQPAKHAVGSGSAKVAGVPATSQQRAAVSPREYLAEARPTNNHELITAIGYYLTHYEGRQEFSNDDIREGIKRAHEALPKNLSRDIGKAVKATWIAQSSGHSGQYYLTTTGIRLAESSFGRAQ